MTTEPRETSPKLISLKEKRGRPKLKLAKAKPVIALAGNPNSGKTSLFNALTGLRYKVANYPGVTVDRKEGALTLEDELLTTLVDLPGLYSLDGTSLDEQISAQVLHGAAEGLRRPDLVLAVIDATNLDRNLFLLSQIIDLGLPVIAVLTMMDVAEKSGIGIAKDLLARRLGIPVVAVVVPQRKGLDELKATARRCLQEKKLETKPLAWLNEAPDVKLLVEQTTELLKQDAALGTVDDTVLMLHVLRLIEGVERCDASPEVLAAIAAARGILVERGIDPSSLEASLRYQWISRIVKAVRNNAGISRGSYSELADRILTHPVAGALAFLLIMGVMFQSIFLWAVIPMEWGDRLVGQFGQFVAASLSEGQLRSLLVDGVIAGVGSVLVFVPQLLILFLFLGVLEDSGYLARAAFITDRVMRVFGLQGRSFIPLLSSFACAVPGIMSARTIPSVKERLVTILIAPLMSCSARLPVYSLLIAAFIPPLTVMGIFSLQGLTLLALYLLGAVGAMAVAFLFRKTIIRGEPALFVMELPPFRLPSARFVLRGAFDRILVFVKSAGTIIVACSVVLWFLSTHPSGEIRDSYAGKIGQFVEPAIKPLGYNWEIGIGLISSFAAREVFVSTLATVYNLQSDDDSSNSLLTSLKTRRAEGRFSTATAVSLLVFYVFACQCMSTLAVARREMGSIGWSLFMFAYLTALAWGGAWVAYRVMLYIP